MPTENRRVATYLPQELDDRFIAFVAERNLPSESQTLIIILTEFFGIDGAAVDRLKPEFDEIDEKFAAMESAIARLEDRLNRFEMQGGRTRGDRASQLTLC